MTSRPPTTRRLILPIRSERDFSASLIAAFAQALAGGAVLAVVVHAMIPEAIEAGGSLVVLPTVAGFIFALYLALAEALR